MAQLDDDVQLELEMRPDSSKYNPVIVGGITGTILTTIVHPLDLMKVRLQVYHGSCSESPSTIALARRILRCEGVTALYNGLTASIMRQATFTTTRLTVFYMLYENYNKTYGIPSQGDKMIIGLYAGLAGALAGNPSEVALVRMMADCKWEPCSFKECKHRKLYNGVFDALYKFFCRIATQEGVCALWRGGWLTITRSALVSVVQVGSYLWTSEILVEDHIVPRDRLMKIHIFSSVISAFLTASVTLPVDTIKTKYQVRSDHLSQKHVMIYAFRDDGFRVFYQGFTPYFIRLSVHTTLAYFILQEVGDIFGYVYQLIKQG